VEAVLRSLLAAGEVVSQRDGSVRPLSPNSVPAAEGRALRDCVVREGAVATIETGFGYGVSTLFICAGLLATGDPAARHVVVDPHQTTRCAGVGLQVVAEAAVEDLLEFHPEPSEVVLPRLFSDRRRFDVGFADGNHRFDGVFLDLVYLGRLVRPGGVVLVDDLQLPAVARAARFCTTNLGWTLEELSVDDELHNWASYRTPVVALERAHDHYVEF
jgi:predicted O-methyltransferase YrrM